MKGAFFVLLLALTFTSDVFAPERKDFKGLFGSYRRERFTENEANDTDFGVDLGLSTLIPVSNMVTSTETAGAPGGPLNFSTFFNYEASFFVTLSYNWEISATIGYYTYDTRKQNSVNNSTDPTQNALPLFHQYNMTAMPLLLGIKYRFSREDIVPYVGLAGGLAYVDRKGSYDYSSISNEEFNTVPMGILSAGVEFYFSSRAGIRLEVGGTYFNLPAFTFDTLGSPINFPIMTYSANPISIRYASSVFFLF